MKLKLFSTLITLGFAGLVLLPVTASAVDVIAPSCREHPEASACQENTNQPINGNGLYGPNGLLTKVASFVAVIVGMASVIMIVIGGFKYVMSSGDPSNVKSAKDTIMFAVVGILVAISAQSIVVFILRGL